MIHMVFFLFPLITTFSNAEEFLKCSAVGKTNQKCFKDFYPDQEAQETNVFSTYQNEYHNEVFQRESAPPALQFTQQDHYIQGQEYDYGYSVNDVTTGDQKSHRESRYDNVVHGTYSLIEPDGSKRTVVYTADDINGFNAVVYRDQSDTFSYGDDSKTQNHILNSNIETFTSGSSNQNIFISDSDIKPTSLEVSGAPKVENYASPVIDPFGNVLNNPDHHHSNTPPILFNSNLPLNPSTHYTNGQRSQNIPIIINTLNSLGSILGEHSFVKSLIEDVSLTPGPILKTSPQDHNTLATDVEEKFSENHYPQISSTTANPIIVHLNSEEVESLNSDLIRKTRPVIIHEMSESSSAQVPPKVKFLPEQNVPNSPKLYPTSLPQFISTTHNSSNSNESSISNSMAIVESPYISVATTPVPITANVIPSRLNTLTDGEFPLLAHVSPSYARRYARHYV